MLSRAKVTPEVAVAAAQKRRPAGKLASAELEEEDGRLIYSFDFKTKGRGGVDEINVDAITGEVLNVEHESPRAEAAEKAADTKANRSR
jgi:uncharacterized membrane protein YkoI